MKVVATMDTKTPSVVSVHCEDEDNIAFIKNISYHSFLELLQKSTVEDENVTVRMGTLPEGWYDGGYNDVTGTYEAIIHVPAAEQPFNYYEKSYILPFPDLVFYLKAQKGRITASKVFALADPIKKGDRLYRYPYGNVYEDGRICWGKNKKLPEITCFKDFEKVIQLFFAAETNNDLYKSPNFSRNSEKVELSQSELIQFLTGKTEFPVEILNPSIKGTVENL